MNARKKEGQQTSQVDKAWEVCHGWIFDLYPSDEGMVVWLKEESGRVRRLTDPLPMRFFIGLPETLPFAMDHLPPAESSGRASPELRRVWRELAGWKQHLRLARVRRHEIQRGEEIDLLEVRASSPTDYAAAVRGALRRWPDLPFYDADLDPVQVYGVERSVFPLAFCTVEIAGGRIRSIATDQSRWDIDAAPPPFRVMTLRLGGDLRDPAHGHRGTLEIAAAPAAGSPGGAWSSDWTRPRELLEAVRSMLEAHDPDILLTAWGDSFILPELLRLSEQHGMPLPLNRDARFAVRRKGERSYFSYGRIIHRASSVWLYGRLHIDRQTAFLADEYGLEGLMELARTTGQPLQQVARTSSGTGISSMQVNEAYRRQWLIPYRKRQPEDFKTALDLVRSDKGGLNFQPEPGLYEHVLEIDFASMYPSLMVKYNLSAETVGRACPRCDPDVVPEIGYPVCRCRPGIVPLTLRPLLEKRLALKAASRAAPEGPEREELRRRQVALKWLLVTCFGYLGYKNARFGRIEAHESTTACGREMLLRAKETAEARGYRFLHALTDALWVTRPGSTAEDHQALVEEIGRVTGIRIDIEGVYNWLCFPPSRVHSNVPVANRYFGAFEDGKVKVRGIEARRHDTVRWIRESQAEMLEILARARDAAGYREKLEEVWVLGRAKVAALRAGEVPPEMLAIRHRLSRTPEEYRVNLPVAIAARELARRGVALAPGESIEFILTQGGGARVFEAWTAADRADVPRYRELFARMLAGLAAPAGFDRAEVEARLEGIRQAPLPGMPKPAAYWRQWLWKTDAAESAACRTTA